LKRGGKYHFSSKIFFYLGNYSYICTVNLKLKEMKTLTKVDHLKSMMKSCFAYGGLEKNSFNYKEYILKFKKEMPQSTFYRVYNTYKKYLKKNYKVLYNTSTDSEGGSYNSLEKK